MKNILLILGLAPIMLFSQKNDYNWLFSMGYYPDTNYSMGIMDFNNHQVAFHHENKFPILDSSYAVVSDSSGQLACYFNGAHLYNSAHEFIENGKYMMNAGWIYNYPCDQCFDLLPYPGHPNQYILFSIQEGDTVLIDNFNWSPFFYSVIDMNENNGKGKVIQRKIPIFSHELGYYPIIPIRHANGRDWWIITRKKASNIFYKVLLTPYQVQEYSTQSIGLPRRDGIDLAVTSPDGRWYAMYSWWGNETNNILSIYLYGFDRCSGEFTSFQYTDLPEVGLGGVAFSPNSRYLYLGHGERLFQYDLQATDVWASGTVVATYDGFTTINANFPTEFNTPLLGPNGKIYINCPAYGTRFLHTINQPNRKGAGCDVRQHSVYLPVYHVDCFPNMPHFRLGAVDGSACDSLGLDNHPLADWQWESSDTLNPLAIDFTDNSFYEPGTWHWDFDGLGMSQDTNPRFTFPQPGNYQVCMTACNQYSCDTLCRYVNVGVSPTQDMLPIGLEQIIIQPNPASDRITVRAVIGTFADAYIGRIVNANGQVAQRFNIPIGTKSQDIPLQDLPSGLYFLQLSTSSGMNVQQKKILVLH